MLNCSMVRFPTGHYWHCSWPVKKASPGMSVEMVDILNTFCEQTLANSCIIHVFLVPVASVHRVRFLLCWCVMVDRPTLLNCKALSLLRTVNEQKVKCWYFACVNLCTYFSDIWHFFYLVNTWWKVTFETCFTCTRIANFWFLSFQSNAATYLRYGG